MKWVRCIENGGLASDDGSYKNITLGKIYEVVEVSPFGVIRIINDANEERGVFLADFEDVTAEVIANERNNKLDNLGI